MKSHKSVGAVYIYIYIYIVRFSKINLCERSKETMCFRRN